MQLRRLLRKLRGTWLHRVVHRVGSAETSAGFDQYLADDRQAVEIMRRVLRPDSNCVDIGSHRGDVVEHMVTFAPNGMHHAFEALPHLVAALRARFPQVIVHPVAASDANGQGDFHFVENDPGYSGLRQRIYDRTNPRITIIPVTTATVDSVVPPDQSISFLKIDIEGGEYHALKGAVATIARGQPVILFEAGSKSTGQYGVTAADMYLLVTQTLGYDLSTMDRWLAGMSGLTRDQFRSHWENGTVYNFIATPARVNSTANRTQTSE